MDRNDIWEVMEAYTTPSNTNMFGSVTASRRDKLNARASIMRFLEELDAGLTVGELRDALEDYEP